MKQILSFVILLASISSLAQKAIGINISFRKKEYSDTISLNSYKVIFEYTNNTDSAYYIDHFGYDIIHPYYSLISGGHIRSSLDVESKPCFYRNSRKGSVNDTVDIKLINERIERGNIENFDLNDTLYNCQELYSDSELKYGSDDYMVLSENPSDRDWLKDHYYDTLLLNFVLSLTKEERDDNVFVLRDYLLIPPNSTRVFSYDIGYLFLRKATYSLQIDIKGEVLADTVPSDIIKKGWKVLSPKARSQKFTELTGYTRYDGSLKSNKIYIVSE